MTQALYYSSTAVAMTLSAPIGSGDTTCNLSATTGLPTSYPFKLLLDWGQASQEVVHCTNISGLVATIVRGQDSTTAQAHAVGASVIHGVSAREFNDLEFHVGNNAGVHGVTGSVVGTTDTQTLTNKTLTSPVIAAISNGGTLTLPTSTDTLVGRATTDTLSNKTFDTANSNTLKVNGNTLTALASTQTITIPATTDTLVARNTADILTNKTIDSASNNLKLNGNPLAASQAGTNTVYVPTAISDTLVGLAGVATLTNKTLQEPVIAGNTGSNPAATVKAGTTQTVDLWQWQDNSGNVTLKVDKNGHLAAQGPTAPTVALGANIGTGAPTPTLNRGNDQCGQISWGTGSNPVAGGEMVKVTFARPYVNTPVVIIGSDTNNGENCQQFSGSVSTTGFSVYAHVAPAASQPAGTYTSTYIVLGT